MIPEASEPKSFRPHSLPSDRGYHEPTERDGLSAMNGTEWPKAVGDIWEASRSRFSTRWDDLPHHDQVAIYRILIRGTP